MFAGMCSADLLNGKLTKLTGQSLLFFKSIYLNINELFFLNYRQGIRKELEQHIRAEYKDAILTLFGSSCNGFGFSDSDLDLCLTFEGNQDGKVHTLVKR